MNSFKESFRNWFGYSRRERRSTFILLNIIVVIFGLRYIYPSGDNSLKIIPIELLNYNTDSSLMIRDTPVLSRQQASKNPIRKRPIMNLNICDSASLVFCVTGSLTGDRTGFIIAYYKIQEPHWGICVS